MKFLVYAKKLNAVCLTIHVEKFNCMKEFILNLTATLKE